VTPSYRLTQTTQATQEPQCQDSLFRLERRIGGWVVLLLAAIVLGSAGCSRLKNENSTAGPGGGASSNSNTASSPRPTHATATRRSALQGNGLPDAARGLVVINE